MLQSTIKKRVIAVIEKKIEDAEKKYVQDVKDIEAEARRAKAQALENAVQGIVSKIL